MSYTETPHDAYQIYGDALWDEFTIPTAQAHYVEVYSDRTEIDRINFAAEDERTYTNGAWGYQSGYPFASAGMLAGPTWTVRLDGSTAEEVRANFDYTAAARDAVAPVQPGAPEHIVTNGADVLRVPAATDDEAVYGYDVRVRDAVTGAEALPIRAGAKVLADFQIAPRPSVLEIPLAIQRPTGRCSAPHPHEGDELHRRGHRGRHVRQPLREDLGRIRRRRGAGHHAPAGHARQSGVGRPLEVHRHPGRCDRQHLEDLDLRCRRRRHSPPR